MFSETPQMVSQTHLCTLGLNLDIGWPSSNETDMKIATALKFKSTVKKVLKVFICFSKAYSLETSFYNRRDYRNLLVPVSTIKPASGSIAVRRHICFDGIIRAVCF